MARLILLIIVASWLAFSTAATAQPICETGGPGSEDCSTSALAEGPDDEPEETLESTERDMLERTHDFFLPNGNLTPKGRIGLRVHGFGAFNTISYGLHDHVEISASAPVVPFFTNVGVRVGLTRPESPFRVTLGASFTLPLIQDDDEFAFLTQPTATIAYRGSSFEVHASLSALMWRFDELMIPMANIGASVRTGERHFVHLNYASININRIDSTENPRLNTVIAGMKYMFKHWDMDFGLMLPNDYADGGDEALVIPFFSLHRLY